MHDLDEGFVPSLDVVDVLTTRLQEETRLLARGVGGEQTLPVGVARDQHGARLEGGHRSTLGDRSGFSVEIAAEQRRQHVRRDVQMFDAV
ncbi:hypothetical protein D3C80_1605860 [compost metagenome]